MGRMICQQEVIHMYHVYQKVKCECIACLHVSDFRTAKIPSPPPGHKWKEVRHDNKVRKWEVHPDYKVRNREVHHYDKKSGGSP
jgi:hypothetical protein